MSVTQSSVSYCAQQMIVESEETLPNFLNFLKIYSLYRILWFSVIHQQESAIGTPMSPPSQTSSPSHLSILPQCPCLSSLSHAANNYCCLFYTWHYKFPCYSLHTTHPLPSSPPLPVLRYVCYVCFSTAAWKINSSVPSF